MASDLGSPSAAGLNDEISEWMTELGVYAFRPDSPPLPQFSNPDLLFELACALGIANTNEKPFTELYCTKDSQRRKLEVLLDTFSTLPAWPNVSADGLETSQDAQINVLTFFYEFYEANRPSMSGDSSDTASCNRISLPPSRGWRYDRRWEILESDTESFVPSCAGTLCMRDLATFDEQLLRFAEESALPTATETEAEASLLRERCAELSGDLNASLSDACTLREHTSRLELENTLILTQLQAAEASLCESRRENELLAARLEAATRRRRRAVTNPNTTSHAALLPYDNSCARSVMQDAANTAARSVQCVQCSKRGTWDTRAILSTVLDVVGIVSALAFVRARAG
eukprot:gnl/Chilomastix_cuspidata/4427.p1 GENE.gnl/Chilomastix_cuspidata/4427~~gnl/Chilomastix_cuspidata/4427.p1  ORF type:complete len:345 (+),score=53.67 gnl/Chilomastix_cuspidata/4427:171-1205(+)